MLPFLFPNNFNPRQGIISRLYIMRADSEDPESLIRLLFPLPLLSFLNVSFISRDTPLLFLLLLFFLSIIIRSSLFPRCSIFPCTRVLSCPRVSSYLSIASIPPFFPFVLPPLSSVFNGPRVFYIPLPPLPIFRYSSHRSNHLCASRFCTAYLVILAPTFFLPLSKSLVLPMRTRIYSTFFIRSPPNPRHIYLA